VEQPELMGDRGAAQSRRRARSYTHSSVRSAPATMRTRVGSHSAPKVLRRPGRIGSPGWRSSRRGRWRGRRMRFPSSLPPGCPAASPFGPLNEMMLYIPTCKNAVKKFFFPGGAEAGNGSVSGCGPPTRTEMVHRFFVSS
jgi:hypothetical protein